MLALDPEAFWRFALALYGEPGAKDLCLSLQEDRSADVNLLLLYLWLDQQHIAITAKMREGLKKLSEDWQANSLRPIRKQRKLLERPSPEYKAKLQEELELERREQKDLVNYLATSGLVNDTQTTMSSHNFEKYLGAINTPLEPYTDLIRLAKVTSRDMNDLASHKD